MKDDTAVNLSLKVTVHNFESEYKSSQSFSANLKIDGKEIAMVNKDKPTIFPIYKTSKNFQIIIKNENGSKAFGSLTMVLAELCKLKNNKNKHWVTLFEDPEDDVYDGNYKENDTEVPRVLISHEILRIKTEVPAEPAVVVPKKEEVLEVVPELYKDEVHSETTETKIEEKKIENGTIVTKETITKKNIKRIYEDEGDIQTMENNAKEDKEKNLMKDTIANLTEENGKLREELQKLEGKRNDFLEKYQTEMKDYDKRISEYVRNKSDLNQKIIGLENSLDDRKSELEKLKKELTEIKEKPKNEIDTETINKIEHYENLIKEYKEKIEITRIDHENNIKDCKTKDLDEYIQKLKELEDQYIKRLKEMEHKFNEAQNKIQELTNDINATNINEKMLKDKISKLEEENKLLSRLRDETQEILKTTEEKTKKLEDDLINLEKKTGEELGTLIKRNIELTSLVEQLKAMLEKNKVEFESIIKEKDNVIKTIKEEKQMVETKTIKETEILKNELNMKIKELENEKDRIKNELETKDQEINKLNDKLKNLEAQLLDKDSIEDELADKNKIIQSLQSINDEYKDSNDELKKRNDDYEKELSKANNRIKEFQDKYFELQRHITTYEETIKKVTYELTIKTNKLEEKESEAENNETKYKSEIENLKSQLKLNEGKLTNYETDKAKLTDAVNNLEEKEKELENYKEKMKAKDDKLQEVTSTLMEQNKLAWELEGQLHQAQEDFDHLRADASQTIAENEELRNELEERDKEIASLTALLSNHGQTAEVEDTKNSQIVYTSDNNDKVDQMFALYINAVRCPVKLKRIAEGQYIFGTKKIFAKIQNERLVIRVGGGYMMIEDFLTTYTAQELSKMKRTEADAEKSMRTNGKEVVFESELESDPNQSTTLPGKKRVDHMVFNKSTSKAIGDKARVPAGTGIRSRSPGTVNMNGTNRTRVLTEQDLANSKMIKTDRNIPKGNAKKGPEEKDKENNTAQAK